MHVRVRTYKEKLYNMFFLCGKSKAKVYQKGKKIYSWVAPFSSLRCYSSGTLSAAMNQYFSLFCICVPFYVFHYNLTFSWVCVWDLILDKKLIVIAFTMLLCKKNVKTGERKSIHLLKCKKGTLYMCIYKWKMMVSPIVHSFQYTKKFIWNFSFLIINNNNISLNDDLKIFSLCMHAMIYLPIWKINK